MCSQVKSSMYNKPEMYKERGVNNKEVVYNGFGLYNSGKKVVPDSYRQVEYVRLIDGTTVNTRVTFGLNDTIKATLYYWPQSGATYSCVFGSRSSAANTDNYSIFGAYQDGVNIKLESGRDRITICSRPNFVFKIEASKSRIVVRKAEDDSLLANKSISSGWTGCTKTMFIGQTSDNNEQWSNVYVYEFIMLNSNNEEKLHLYPVQRVSDSRYGLYDSVNKRFITQYQGSPIQGPV